MNTRRVSAAVASAGLSSFALLYVPQPVLPQLAAAYRLDPGSASLAIGVATASLAVAVLPLAWVAGRVGRRRVILWSVVVSALIGLLLPLAPSFPALLVMRGVQGVAIAGFAGVAAAYLADQVGTARLPGAVGAMIAGNSVGGMLGRLGAGFTAGPLGWHAALVAVAGVSLVCVLFTVMTLPREAPGTPRPDPGEPDGPDPREPAAPERVTHELGARSGVAVGAGPSPAIGVGDLRQSESMDGPGTGRGEVPGDSRREVAGGARREMPDGPKHEMPGRPVVDGRRERLGWGLMGPFAVGTLATGAFVALYNAAGFRLAAPPLSLTPAAASLVFLSYAMGTASSAATGRMVNRLGRTPTLVTALLATVVGTVLTAHSALPVVALGFAVLTAGFFAAHAIANAWVTAAAPPHSRGRAAGVYTLCYYLGSGAGGTAGGIVYGHAGWTWLIALTSAWLLLAAIAVLVSRRHPPTLRAKPGT
ncbi:MFS transporter [Nonomuraea sp. NPDC050643]|uniref:MFS transporter n=1 Tax=Nonomuraea sp. NPDC050643 TaxID=3155660 RepID=UPI0033E94611